VSIDGDREEAVVAVRASGPLQYVVCLATVLASPRLINRVLTDSRLKSFEDPPAILRDARCIGALSNEALEDPKHSARHSSSGVPTSRTSPRSFRPASTRTAIDSVDRSCAQLTALPARLSICSTLLESTSLANSEYRLGSTATH
jgi:hypothetical protein